ELEDSLQHGREFSYHFPETRVPLLFTEKEWRDAARVGKREPRRDLLELIIRRPTLARLYWALSRTDGQTRDILEKKICLEKLLPYAAELDYYGTQILVRAGSVQVPGGAAAEQGWTELVGANPRDPGDFVQKLLAKDKGWLAAYFDCLARVSASQQQHFSDPRRLKTFYVAFRGDKVTAEAARPAFRLAPGLLLLLTRLQWESDGQPLVPGGLDLWKQLLRQKSEHSIVRERGKAAAGWTTSDQLLESMFAFAKLEGDDSPLRMYLLFSSMDSSRSPHHRLKPETFQSMA